MDKIKEILKKLTEKIKGLSKTKKIVFGILSLCIIGGIINLIIFLNTTKYAVLYKDMDPTDAQKVLAKLNESKIEYKVENNVIKVPEEKVSELRLNLAPSINNGNKGYEILDDSSAFGMTDKERSLKYKMAIEGELAKDISSLPEVKDAKVLLVMQEDSNFFKESEPAQASVRLGIEPGKNITKDQVKAIVSLITGSVKNLSKENVKVVGVIDNKTVDLSEDLFKDDNTQDLATATDEQQKYKKNLEKEYEKKILRLLSPKYGEGVKASVNVDVDFDATQKTSTIYDPNNVVRSEESVKDSNSSTQGNTSSGPVDNNMSNTYSNGAGKGQSTHEQNTKNYEVGKIEKKTIEAPGKVNKVAASVTVNNENLEQAEKDKISSLVSAAIAYNEDRGDIISVEGMKFAGIDPIQNQDDTKKQEEDAKKKTNMYIYGGIGAAALILLALVFIILRKRRKRKEEEEEELEGIDTIIDDNVEPKEPMNKIEFEEENERTHIEKEIKKYATEKPEQVVEIIKAWMAEDER